MRGNGTAHSIPSKDLIKEVNALKAQLKRVSDAMAADASDGVHRVVDAVETKSRETLDEVVDSTQQVIDDYTDAAKETVNKIARKSSKVRDNAADSLLETVQARPFGTLAAVVGIGFLAGYLCRRV